MSCQKSEQFLVKKCSSSQNLGCSKGCKSSNYCQYVHKYKVPELRPGHICYLDKNPEAVVFFIVTEEIVKVALFITTGDGHGGHGLAIEALYGGLTSVNREGANANALIEEVLALSTRDFS